MGGYLGRLCYAMFRPSGPSPKAWKCATLSIRPLVGRRHGCASGWRTSPPPCPAPPAGRGTRCSPWRTRSDGRAPCRHADRAVRKAWCRRQDPVQSNLGARGVAMTSQKHCKNLQKKKYALTAVHVCTHTQVRGTCAHICKKYTHTITHTYA